MMSGEKHFSVQSVEHRSMIERLLIFQTDTAYRVCGNAGERMLRGIFDRVFTRRDGTAWQNTHLAHSCLQCAEKVTWLLSSLSG